MQAEPNIVLAHGCFDLIHVGHIRHLQEARKQGDKLVVSVTSDRFVNKGHDRPRFGQEQRMEALRALRFVDEVVLNDAPDAVPVIEALKPAVYVKGVDYDGHAGEALRREAEAAVANGGRLYVTKSAKWSSSRIINETEFDAETVRFLEYARAKGYRDRIMAAFEAADRMSIGFIGETIVDEYRYVRAIGKPSKEVAIATVNVDRELFEGGVLAAAKHGEWRDTAVATAPRPLTKTRFVDSDFNRKLFEVYSEQHLDLMDVERKKFTAAVSDLIARCGAVIVFDFGHGLLGGQYQPLLSEANFLAVNAQSNAGNYGFNLVTKYSDADMVCVDDPEARLATGMQHEPIDIVIEGLAMMMRKDARYIVTHGKNGCLSFYQNKVIHIPAFSSHGIDTMGAGDAFLAVAAPLAATGLPTEMAAFAGNVAGAIKIGIVGHRRHVEREKLIQTIDTLLK